MFKIRYLLVVVLWLPNIVFALVDPTQPANYQREQKQEVLQVESILLGAGRKVAVISGKVVGEGDRIGNTEIISINKDSVKISNGGKFSTLKLNRTSIRQEK